MELTKLRALTCIIGLLWSGFQLWVVNVPLNDTLLRCVHLSFAILLAFLLSAEGKTSKTKLSKTLNILTGIFASGSVLYLALAFEQISNRPGLPTSMDLFFGSVTILLLLEATRRTLGFPLVVLGAVFLAYCYFGSSMPDMIAHRGASFRKIISHMYLGTEGIFGVPLQVSAGMVFLFVLFGALLEKAGAGQYFIDLAYAVLGKYRGGPAKAAVVASGLTGMISGSSIANTVTTGTFTIPLMKKIGMPAYKAAAVEVAASTNGQLMPPIMGAAAFIMAEFLGVSYFEVAKAALIPALVSYLGLFWVVHLEAEKMGLQTVPAHEIPRLFRTLFKGIHFLLPIVFLLYSLIITRVSPSLAAFHAILVLLLIMILQHPIRNLRRKNSPLGKSFQRGLNDILDGLIMGARNMVPIAIATGAAGLIVGTITLTGLGQQLLELISAISMGNFILVLLFTAITSLILGMGLPTTANYIVMASLTAPIILELAASSNILIPAIAAHLFVFYFGILADDTPPVGLAAYAAAGIAQSDPIRTGIQGFTYDLRTAILPWIFIFNTDLLLIHNDFETHGEWLPITKPWIAILVFLQATVAMYAFISFLVGYTFGKLSWAFRILFLAFAFLCFRPSFSQKWLHWENRQTMILVFLFFYGLLMAFLWARQRRSEYFDK